MRIAFLGWGSLIWDPRGLKLSGSWQEDGPFIPTEFARVSSDGRLTLVLHSDAPKNQVLWALSSCTDLTDAIENLAEREGTSKNNIGFVSISEKKRRGKAVPQILFEIEQWARSKEMDAIVWTDLQANFKKRTGMKFNKDNVVEYLRGLKTDQLRKAEEYVRKTPIQIRTPIRTQLEGKLKWYPATNCNSKENHAMNTSHTRNLDHAFEIVLLLLSILFATLFQHLTWVWQNERWEGISSFMYAFFLAPLVLVLIFWLNGQVLVDDDNKKMAFRTISWMLGLASVWSYTAIIILIIFAGVGRITSGVASVIGIMVAYVISSSVTWPWLFQLYRKIMKLYRKESERLGFWEKGETWTYHKAKRIGFTIIGVITGMVIVYISAIPIF